MGTAARIVLHAPDATTARAAAGAAFARMEALEDSFSDYRADSELARLCARAGQGPVSVSADLFGVLDRALEVARATGGAFDPTIGPLTHLWRAARAAGVTPAPAELAAARARVDWRALRLDPASRTAELELPGMQLDLGAIGKGIACDAALAVLREQGYGSALVQLSGDHALGDPPPGRAGFTIEVGSGLPGEPAARLVLRNCGVSVSGAAEQHLDAGGVRYSHILDPARGSGITAPRTVTVVAATAALADALATAVSVLGPAAGRRIAEQRFGARVIVDEAVTEPAAAAMHGSFGTFAAARARRR